MIFPLLCGGRRRWASGARFGGKLCLYWFGFCWRVLNADKGGPMVVVINWNRCTGGPIGSNIDSGVIDLCGGEALVAAHILIGKELLRHWISHQRLHAVKKITKFSIIELMKTWNTWIQIDINALPKLLIRSPISSVQPPNSNKAPRSSIQFAKLWYSSARGV